MSSQTLRLPTKYVFGSILRNSPWRANTRHLANLTRVYWSPDNKESKGTTDQRSGSDEPSTTVEIPEVILKEVPDAKLHWEYQQPDVDAQVYDRKPVKVKCTEGKVYMW